MSTEPETTVVDAADVPATALSVRESASALSTGQWTPRMVVPIEEAVAAIDQRREFMNRVLEKIDGAIVAIPNVEKKVLGKPGAEALLNAFGLRAELSDEEPPVLDFTGEHHGGEPFFRHRQRCSIFWYPTTETRILVAQASGSCNSWESKYRYRNAQRVCPSCGQATIIKGKAQYGGGWLCWKKKGGCDAKFSDDDPKIVDQEIGKVPNPDLADVENTVLKMAEKRALVAATIIATAFSDLVTQDIDDVGHDSSAAPVEREDGVQGSKPAVGKTAPGAERGGRPTSTPQTDGERHVIIAAGECIHCRADGLTTKSGKAVKFLIKDGQRVCNGYDPEAGETDAQRFVQHVEKEIRW